MPLETGSYIGDLVTTNPASSDAVGAGDDHLRLIKSTLKATFPFMGGPAWRQRVVAASTTITATTENMTHFVTTNNVNLNLPDGATAGDGWMGVIFPVAAGTTVHLVPAGVNTINAATATASVQYGTIGLLFGTGGAWYLHKVPRYEGNSLYIPGGATISGSVVLTTGPLVVPGSATISALAVTGGMRNEGATTLSGSVQIMTDLTVHGQTTLSGVTSCVGKLTCSGGADISTASIGTGVILGGLSISGACVMNTTLVVQGSATISALATNGFRCDGDASISGRAVIGGNLYVAGNGGLTVSAGILCASIEVVGAAIGSASFIDFKNDIAEDFDARIVLTGDNSLDVQGLSASGFLKDGEVIYHESNILGTVSQSGGVPTGAIIERGSNANGTYVRFADGTQICEHSISWADINTASAVSELWTTTGTLSWTYPAAFVTTPAFTTGTPSNFGGTWGGGGSTTNSTTGVYFAYKIGSYTGAFNMNVIATGRWF